MRREITAPGVAEPLSHYCDAVEANGFLFVSGCPATRRARRPRRRRRHRRPVRAGAQEPRRRSSQAAGCAPADVVKVNVYLTDVDDRPLINPLRQAFFGESRPASTLVGVRELPVPGMKVEIEAVAVLPDRFGRAQQAQA